jgi:signal transduction histidine kinase
VVLEEVDMGITVQDRTGALRYANQAAAELVGFQSPEELVAANPKDVVGRFEIFHADGTPFPFDQLPSRKALDGVPTDETMLRFKTRGARDEHWSLLHSIPVRDHVGAVVLALNFFREVTRKTREEQQRAFLLRVIDELTAARDYEATLANVARLSVPAIADWCAIDLVAGARTKRVELAHVDPTKLTFVAELERRYPSNPNATTGVPAIIRTGQPELMADIPHERLVAAAIDDEHRKLIEQLEIRSYVGVPLRVRGKTIGALTLVMAESGRRFTEDDLHFAQAVADRAALAIDNARLLKEIEDANAHIADQLVAESRRRAEAENASRFAETFIGILGHDLRNPLNAVTMAAAVLRQRVDHVHAKTIDRIEASTTRMSNMVTQLLDLTRSRLGGGIVLDKSSCDLGAVISDVIDELQLAHGDRTIRWNKRGVVGTWDRDRLAQVASNLVGNALEHGDPDQPVEVSLETTVGGASFTVRSRGKVIAPDLIPVLFDPYRQAALRGARSRGLGLGLFITQQIVQAHDGQIDVTSTDDGTTFTVTLPRAADEKLAEAPALRIQSSGQ